MAKIRTLEDLEALRREGAAQLHPPITRIAVGLATCGVSSGARAVYDALAAAIDRTGLPAVLTQTGCIGFCQREPLVDVALAGGPRLIYQQVTEDEATAIVERLAAGEIPAEHALCRLSDDLPLLVEPGVTYAAGEDGLSKVPFFHQVPFFGKQVRISLRNCGLIDPSSIKEYISRGGYQALFKVLHEHQPEGVIDEITASGLRGRGGAGFPTGQKWRFCREAEADQKYVICNADEGDPGAFMDRNILEGDPHSVIEGMAIGGYAMGATEGYIYCRAEYPLALERLDGAIRQARELGLLGEDILGTGFRFDLKVRAGAGAFVCGEETSLIASIEGRVGEPRTRPPFPAQSGLWGKPTNINNVKTWSHVAPIMVRGADWYGSLGSRESRGTTVFSLVGKVKNTGLVEIPLGMSLREMIEDIGEGVVTDLPFKAVQTGGPSGGCLPAKFLDTPITYEDLGALGSIMGSGGMIVMDESTCMVDLARFFISFTEEESCGKCTPCREGTRRLNQILEAICEGRAQPADLDTLEELANYIKDTSLCGLGGTAPNPVLTTLRYFRDEYEAHVLHRQCPSRACSALTPVTCQNACPAGIDVPSYVALIARGEFQAALDLIREDNPLPAICGYVCTHPCETACKRAEVDTPVAIKQLKRFVADWEMAHGAPPVRKAKRRSKDKVAIVGAGPAGLTAAHFLAREGFPVTVFEACDEAGGMLVQGIPEFRLPREVIRYEIKRITKLGVKIRCGVRIGRDLDLAGLKDEGYKAVYLATGAYREVKLNIPGEDRLSGVRGSLEFLREAGAEPRPELKGQVVVIGGGNAAVDCARTAKRLGPERVTILYRRTRDEMPADASEIAAAEGEGIEIRTLTSPVRLLGDGETLTGIECIENRLGEPDESGRRRPIPVEGSEFTLEADLVITAIGQEPNPEVLAGIEGVAVDARRRIAVDPATLQTGADWVFAGGDVVTGPATVIRAVAAGKRAATSIGRFLTGEDMTEHAPVPIPRRRVEESATFDEDQRAALVRPAMPARPAAERTASFELVELGFDEAVAVAEAHRCLRCDINR